MRILELQEFAKDNGYDSLRFQYKNLKGETKYGQLVDAYFGMFKLDGMGNNFIMVKQWRGMFDDALIEFEPITD